MCAQDSDVPGRVVLTQSQVGTEKMRWQSFSTRSGPRADLPTTQASSVQDSVG